MVTHPLPDEGASKLTLARELREPRKFLSDAHDMLLRCAGLVTAQGRVISARLCISAG